MNSIALSFARTTLVPLLLLATTIATSETPNDADRQLAKQFASELKAALTNALQSSPEKAIAVCNESAPQIAMKIAREQDVQIGRTALKLRNPNNEPTQWQRAVLLDFQNRVAAGESPATLEYAVTSNAQGKMESRYMKAIGTEPLCLTCHGDQIAPEIMKAIKTKYPADQANGFKVGDLRGALYIVRRVGSANESKEH
jgi:hypothetical protein